MSVFASIDRLDRLSNQELLITLQRLMLSLDGTGGDGIPLTGTENNNGLTGTIQLQNSNLPIYSLSEFYLLSGNNLPVVMPSDVGNIYTYIRLNNGVNLDLITNDNNQSKAELKLLSSSNATGVLELTNNLNSRKLKLSYSSSGTCSITYTGGAFAGLTYGANYFSPLVGTDRTIPDIGYVNTLIASTKLIASATLDFNLTMVDYEELSINVPGAALNDVVSIGIPNSVMVDDIIYTGWVSATDTVSIRASKMAGLGAIDPVSGTFKVIVFK